MIAIVKPGTPKEGVAQLCEIIESKGVSTSVIEGANQTIIGLVGDTTRIDPYLLESNSMVEAVRRVSEPFKKANRKFHPDDTVIEVGGVKIGGKDNFAVMAGPCSVESEEQCMIIADQVKKHGAAIFRGLISRISPERKGLGFHSENRSIYPSITRICRRSKTDD